LRALIIEDSADDALLILDTLQQGGFDVSSRRVQSAAETQAALKGEQWDIVFADYMMRGFTGMDALALSQKFASDTPFIIVSGSIGEDIAVDAMRAGANDYVMKDRLQRLPAAVERELREAENRKQKREAERERDRQRQELAARAEQLYRSNRDLERFAFIAAHDLQEPLRNVRAFSQLIVRRYAPEDGDARQFALFVSEGVQRMEALIRGLLSYSRAIHDGSISPVTVDTGKIVALLMRQLSVHIGEAAAEITFGPLPTVVADELQLMAVLQNLLSNALKYRQPDSSPKIHISGERRRTDTLFSVADNGIGIPREYQEQIFVIFKRLHRSAEIPGIGVGLSLAKRLVRNHGGDIWVESEPGKGSTFYFTIPHEIANSSPLASTRSRR
jgi:light-regulated signal transduction histidine kinase (bacteriophytochrome)